MNSFAVAESWESCSFSSRMFPNSEQYHRLGNVELRQGACIMRLQPITAKGISHEAAFCKLPSDHQSLFSRVGKLSYEHCFFLLSAVSLTVRHITAMVEPFAHKPLDLLNREIRLFRFTPWGFLQQCLDRKQMHFEIRSFHLDACPVFTALSYEWGASTRLHDIFIDLRRLGIRGNLFCFLEHLRSGIICGKYEQGWIWADQICIAQNLNGERNHQVQLMRKIFQQASEVLAWLGAPIITKPEINRRQIAMSSYWTRLWIIQELLLARKTLLAADGADVDLDKLDVLVPDKWASRDVIPAKTRLVFSSKAGELGHTFAPGPKHFFNIWRMRNGLGPMGTSIRGQYGRNRQKLPLDAALRRYSQAECSDPRDKIFGLQGIVIEEHRLKVDYEMPLVDVLRVAIAKVMRTKQGELAFQVEVWENIANGMGLNLVECAEIGEFVTKCANRKLVW